MKIKQLILTCCTALLLAGCDREEAIRVYSAPKDPPAPVSAKKSAEATIHWSTPESWKKLPNSQFSYAAYQVGDNAQLRMTVSQVTLTGSVAKTVLDNVNRWNGQVGLPEIAEADLAKIAPVTKVDGRDMHVMDLAGPQARMLAALMPDGDKVWAFKLMGPSDVVAPHKAAFEELVKSVHFDGPGGHQHAEAPAQPAQAAPVAAAAPVVPVAAAADAKIQGLSEFKLPEGWQMDANPRPMRAATIVIPGENGQKAEIIVSSLGAASLADIGGNINRWRGQVKLPPTNDANAHPAQEVTLAQGPAHIRDFAGPEDAGAARLRQVVAYTQFPKAEQIWFFRMVGPHDLVAKSKPAFEAFVRSVKIDQK